MGACANALGGIHMQKLFMLSADNSMLSSLFRCAENALGKIKQKTSSCPLNFRSIIY